jgi:hypothetical protein
VAEPAPPPPVESEPAPPVAEPAPPPPVESEPAPPVVESAPAPPVVDVPATIEPVLPVTEAAAPVETETIEPSSSGATGEAGPEGLPAQAAVESSQGPADGAQGVDHGATEVAPEASLLATSSTTSGVQESASVPDRPPASPRPSSARRAEQAGCDPAAIVAGDADGWLYLAIATSTSTTGLAAVEASRAASAAAAPADRLDGGSVAENHPSAPTPGPGPGGGGGSAAGGGSGSASSASFALVGVLLQAAPRAIRRFRLAQPSWRTSFFVLIPERPD